MKILSWQQRNVVKFSDHSHVTLENLHTIFLKENRWNAVASPTISEDGLYLYYGIRMHQVRGWTTNRDFNDFGNLAVDSLPANPTFPRERKFQNKCRCPVAAL